MPGFRLTGDIGALSDQMIQSGDTPLFGDLLSVNATVGAATITAAQMLTGILARSGSTAGYTDTFDTSTNIYNALSGGVNGVNPVVSPGTSFKLRILNTVAFIETLTAGQGMLFSAVGSNIFTIAASYWRDFLFTFTSVQQPEFVLGNTTNGSPVVTFQLSFGQSSLPITGALGTMLAVGATVIGTGIPANTTILGITQGQGGITGLTLSANATATGTASLTVVPTITVYSIGSGPL
jgi:hypothetical protein